MSDTPLADGIPGDPADETADDRTPEQVAHDDAVPETVPDADPAPDDDGAAVFVASTDPADTAPDAAPDVAPDAAPDAAPEDAAAPSPDTEVAHPYTLDNGDDVLALVKDTNDRIRNIETIVSGFVADAKPFIEKIEKGGITALIGGLFGRG